jgi:hypothetical protein
MKKKIVFFVFLIFCINNSFSQVGIGTITPNTSSILDLTSTDKGFLLPRMTLLQKTAITTPASGLLIYQTDGTSGFYYYNGASWTFIGGTTETASNGLTKSINDIILGGNLTGNTTITNNAKTLAFAGSASTTTFTSSGFVGVGTATPNQKVSVQAGNIEIQDNNDNIITSRNTAQNLHHSIIGTYMGWDQRGVYLAGYNQNNIGFAPYSATNRIYCGGAFGSLPITATAFTVASSRRYKQNIENIEYGLATIMKLRPVKYQYVFEKLQQTHQGLIAEEVNEIIPEIVVKQNDNGEETIDKNAKTMGINYSEIAPILIKGIQEQQVEIASLKLDIKDLKEKLTKMDLLEKQIEEIQKKLKTNNSKSLN